ncbi:hypothetical protein CHI00_16300 [Bacillus velezensis]|nr:hypothetical protein EF87_03755 [Bacillus amyloliquefaciens]PAE32232.1 hypothetical protein CHI00_16300 [Bacillus velezensis]
MAVGVLNVFLMRGRFCRAGDRPLKPGKGHRKDMNKSSPRTIPQAVFSFTRHAGQKGKVRSRRLWYDDK